MIAQGDRERVDTRVHKEEQDTCHSDAKGKCRHAGGNCTQVPQQNKEKNQGHCTEYIAGQSLGNVSQDKDLQREVDHQFCPSRVYHNSGLGVHKCGNRGQVHAYQGIAGNSYQCNSTR